jgi:hypothetical protein
VQSTFLARFQLSVQLVCIQEISRCGQRGYGDGDISSILDSDHSMLIRRLAQVYKAELS